MKKVIIIDGGPRRNMNTAQMLHRLADGAKSVRDYSNLFQDGAEYDALGCYTSDSG